jgi:hypothetical protein
MKMRIKKEKEKSKTPPKPIRNKGKAMHVNEKRQEIEVGLSREIKELYG